MSAKYSFSSSSHSIHSSSFQYCSHSCSFSLNISTVMMFAKSGIKLFSNSHKCCIARVFIIFAASASLGLYLAGNHILPFVENSRVILALAVGIFLHISTTILFELSEGHKFDLKKFLIIIIGFVLAIFTL